MHWWQIELKFNIYQFIIYLFLICLNLTTILNESEHISHISNETESATELYCHVFNCEYLKCRWQTPASYEFKELQVFIETTQQNCSDINEIPIYDYKFYECTWTKSASICSRQRYELTLESRDTVNDIIIIQNTSFNSWASVIPAPPINFRVTNRTSRAVLLKWDENIHLVDFEPGLSYQIEHLSKPSNLWTHIDIPEKDLGYDSSQKVHYYWLTNLQPYTEYKISMRLFSNEAKDDHFWSEYSKVNARTYEDIPECPPKIVNGSFYVENNTKYRNITLYFKPITIHEQNSNQVNYIFQIYRNNIWSDLVPNEIKVSYAKFCNLDFDEYIFRVYSQNRIGRSEKYSVVKIPNTDSMLEPTIASISKINDYRCIFWDNNLDIDNYVIFWCIKIGISCYHVDWLVLNGTKNSSCIKVPDEVYNEFGISTQTMNSSSGIHWIRCESICPSKECLRVKKIRTFEIDIMWKRLNCWNERIEALRIIYCPVNKIGDTCNDLKIHEEWANIYMPIQTVLSNLEPYTLYRIVLKTPSGQEIGNPEYVRTKEDKPNLPRNFVVFNVTNNSIIINWSSPIRWNGPFGAYIIRYRKVQENDWRHFLEISNETITRASLPNLVSNTEYNISLSACNALSRCSTVFIKERTKIGAPGQIQNIKPLFDRLDLKNFTWDEPEEILNTTHKYEYKCEFIKNNKSSKIWKAGYVSDNSLILSIPTEVCKDSEQTNLTYIQWKVRGIVIDDMNNELKGEWSEGQRIFDIPVCEKTSINLILICLLIFIIVVTAVTFGLISLKRIINQYSDIEVKLPEVLTMNKWVIDEKPEHNSFKIQYQDAPLQVLRSTTTCNQDIDTAPEELSSSRLQENMSDNNGPYYSVNMQLATISVEAKIEFNSNIIHNLDKTKGNKKNVINREENLAQTSNTNIGYCPVNNLKPMTPIHALKSNNIENETKENPNADSISSENLAQASNTSNGYCPINNLKPMSPNYALSSSNIHVKAKENSNANTISSENLAQASNTNNGYCPISVLKSSNIRIKPKEIPNADTINSENLTQVRNTNNGYYPVNNLKPITPNHALSPSKSQVKIRENSIADHINSENLGQTNNTNNGYCPVNNLKPMTPNHALKSSNIQVQTKENPNADSISSENLTQASNASNDYSPIYNLKTLTPNNVLGSSNIQVKAKENPIADHINIKNLAQASNTENGYYPVNTFKPMTAYHASCSGNDQVKNKENSVADYINSENLAQASNTNNGYCPVHNVKPITLNHALSSSNVEVQTKENSNADLINNEI